ncbi:MAG: hypothetical protein GXO48_07630 [Chlorobi bacterium]|nr:hypothetical protein [Chlorobiota bacterium]
MRKMTLIFTGFLFVSHTMFSQGMQSQIAYDSKTRIGFGHDNNVFRSPPEYRPPNTPPDSLRDPRQQDNFLYFRSRHRFQKFFTPKHRFRLVLDGQLRRFIKYPEYSEYDLKGQLKYRFKPWKISGFFFGTGVRRAHKRLFNVLGQGLARLFTFTDLSISHWQRWRPVRFLIISPKITYIYRDYVEIPGRMSLDHSRVKMDIKIQVIPDKNGYHQVFVRPYMQYRDYKAWIVRDSLGNRLPTYPLRKYNYTGIEVGYQFDMDKLKVDLSYYIESRRDNFQQWYGYDESGFLFSASYRLPKLNFSVFSSLRNRDWLRKRGHLLNGNKPPLIWRRFKLGGEVAFFPLKWLGTYLNMTYMSRGTNVEVPFKKVNRSYKAFVFHAGLFLRFSTKNKPAGW